MEKDYTSEFIGMINGAIEDEGIEELEDKLKDQDAEYEANERKIEALRKVIFEQLCSFDEDDESIAEIKAILEVLDAQHEANKREVEALRQGRFEPIDPFGNEDNEDSDETKPDADKDAEE